MNLSEINKRRQEPIAPAVASIFKEAGNYAKAIYFMPERILTEMTQSSSDAKPFILMGLHDRDGNGSKFDVILPNEESNPSNLNYLQEEMPKYITPEDIVQMVKEAIESPDSSPKMRFQGSGVAVNFLRDLQEKAARNPELDVSQVVKLAKYNVGLSVEEDVVRSLERPNAPRPS